MTVIVFAALILSECASDSPLPINAAAAMASIYNAWKPNVPDSWDPSNTDCSSWEGLTCDYYLGVKSM